MIKTFQIASVPIKNRYVAAPLAGYSDFAMRTLSASYGAGLVYTEMESCLALLYGSKPTREDVIATKRDRKEYQDTRIALQIFGGEEESILRSVPLFEEYGDFDFLDFNCGCPVKKVLSQNAGSAWLKRPDELVSLMGKLVEKSHHPVIIKMRLGFDSFLDMPKLCKQLENVGVQAIAIHGRTRNEFFQGPVHYERIKAVKDAVSIPVIANGGITEENAKDVFAETSADALMLGTRIIGYPKVFQDLLAEEEGKKKRPVTLSSQVKDLEKHLRLIFSQKSEREAANIMRSISTRYIRGFSSASKIRLALVHCESLKEYLEVLGPYENSDDQAI